jgi:hypothetical protein
MTRHWLLIWAIRLGRHNEIVIVQLPDLLNSINSENLPLWHIEVQVIDLLGG